MIHCTLIHECHRLTVDLRALPVPGTEIGGCLSTLTLRVERVQQWPAGSGVPVCVWIGVPGFGAKRPVPEAYWAESGWTRCECG